MFGNLFLIPVTLGETEISRVLPDYNKEIILSLKYFIVENVRTARRFLKKIESNIYIDEITFFILNKHTPKKDFSIFLQPLVKGNSIGVLSEAGCPAIADPGADIIAIAQQKNIRIIPLVGPSSILLALMASGLNGQYFCFHGYLPIGNMLRIKMLKKLEQKIYPNNQTQLFIETPYRNNKILEDILNNCSSFIRLCIAADITFPTEFIKTRTIDEWKKEIPNLSKKPCIFIMGK